jgi:hypothetical protein
MKARAYRTSTQSQGENNSLERVRVMLIFFIRELYANVDTIAGEADKTSMKSREASLSSEGVPQKLAS